MHDACYRGADRISAMMNDEASLLLSSWGLGADSSWQRIHRTISI